MTIPLSPEERRDLLVSLGTHRGERRLSPVDVARLFRRALEAGASLSDCAEAGGFKGTSMVRRFLRLLDLSPRMQATVGWGSSETTLPFSAATEIARLPPAAREVTAERSLSAGLKTQEVKQLVQRVLRGGVEPKAAAEEILALRPRVERRHVFIGSVTNPEVAARMSGMAQSQRDLLLDQALESLIGSVERSARLTPFGFVITGDDHFADAIRGLDDFEAAVTCALARLDK